MFTTSNPGMYAPTVPHRDPDQVNEMQSRWALLSEAAKATQSSHTFGQRSSNVPTPRLLADTTSPNIRNVQTARYDNNKTLASSGDYKYQADYSRSLASTSKPTQGRSFQQHDTVANKRKSPGSWDSFKPSCQEVPNDPGYGNSYGSYSGETYSSHSSFGSSANNTSCDSRGTAYTLTNSDDPDAMDVD